MEKTALENYLDGYNCTQAILKSLSHEFDMKEEDLLKISHGLGVGMYIGETCGAVTAAVMAFSLKKGSVEPGDKQGLRKIYKLTKTFEKAFKDKHCSLNCKELKTVYTKDCNELIEDSAKLIKEILEK